MFSEIRESELIFSGLNSMNFSSRLEAYERNKNFGQPDLTEPEYNMVVPDGSLYKDVNADTKFCDFSMDTVVHYLHQFDKELDIKTIQEFYDDTMLKYFRLASENEKMFVKSACQAEYIKCREYFIDIAIDKDGLIIESQCDCGGGMGPNGHCKHICVVLYGAYKFSQKKTIKVQETCTQKLQTFHRSKRFVGSPLKANQLNVPGADEITNVTFDPRPPHYRGNPGYQDFFRNTCLNFSGVSTMPVFQLFEPANALAIAKDHDYLKLTPEDNFLEKLCVTTISEQERVNVEERTLGQTGNPLWAEERTKRLPSSQFGRICKAMSDNSKSDKNKLIHSLVTISHINAPSLQHGKKYEELAVSKYMTDFGQEVKKCGIVVCQEYPFLACSPDGIIDKSLLLEVKCPYSAKDKMITPVTVPYLKMNEESKYYLNHNHDYYYQVQGQLLCTGAQKCIFAVFTGVDIKYVTITRDNEFIKDMVEKLKLFFKNHFRPALLEKRFYKTYIP